MQAVLDLEDDAQGHLPARHSSLLDQRARHTLLQLAVRGLQRLGRQLTGQAQERTRRVLRRVGLGECTSIGRGIAERGDAPLTFVIVSDSLP